MTRHYSCCCTTSLSLPPLPPHRTSQPRPANPADAGPSREWGRPSRPRQDKPPEPPARWQAQCGHPISPLTDRSIGVNTTQSGGGGAAAVVLLLQQPLCTPIQKTPSLVTVACRAAHLLPTSHHLDDRETGSQLQMDRLSLRNKRLKFMTAGKLLIILEEFIEECTPI